MITCWHRDTADMFKRFTFIYMTKSDGFTNCHATKLVWFSPVMRHFQYLLLSGNKVGDINIGRKWIFPSAPGRRNGTWSNGIQHFILKTWIEKLREVNGMKQRGYQY
ncbi:uncharacterized protein [Palaemon carinicauda]|uniref:uncharacterized protein n=1 Tax=Palaemon carinicauda TaxID=392227 RepID=UPI0035B581C2